VGLSTGSNLLQAARCPHVLMPPLTPACFLLQVAHVPAARGGAHECHPVH
jgi:hypothetical protein